MTEQLSQSRQLINNNLFLIVLEAGSQKSEYQPGQVRGFLQTADISLFPHTPQPNGIYSRYARLVQHSKLNLCNS